MNTGPVMLLQFWKNLNNDDIAEKKRNNCSKFFDILFSLPTEIVVTLTTYNFLLLKKKIVGKMVKNDAWGWVYFDIVLKK